MFGAGPWQKRGDVLDLCCQSFGRGDFFAQRRDTIGVGALRALYLRRGHPRARQAPAMFVLKRKSGHAQCSIRCSAFEMRTHAMLVTRPS